LSDLFHQSNITQLENRRRGCIAVLSVKLYSNNSSEFHFQPTPKSSPSKSDPIRKHPATTYQEPTMSTTRSRPYENAIAFGGVATGNMNA